MIAGLLLSGFAWASDPPDRPAPPLPVAGECARVVPLDRGSSPPTTLVVDNAVVCSAVAVPLSQYADLLKTEIWAQEVANSYLVRTSTLEFQLAWYEAELSRVTKPSPLWQRPSTLVVVGSIVGASSVLLSAYTLGFVADLSTTQ